MNCMNHQVKKNTKNLSMRVVFHVLHSISMEKLGGLGFKKMIQISLKEKNSLGKSWKNIFKMKEVLSLTSRQNVYLIL